MPVQTLHSGSDTAWFAEQIAARLPELYGRALRLCRNPTDAEDLVADTVARAWQALGSLQDRSAFRGWVFRILNNAFVSSWRAQSRTDHEPLPTSDEDFSLFERLHQPFLLWWGTPETDFLNRLLGSDIERAIERLPDVFREVVVLVDVQGLAYAEVADLLNVPVGTVRSRLSRGRSLLQKALWEHGREAGLTSASAPTQHPRDGAHDHD